MIYFEVIICGNFFSSGKFWSIGRLLQNKITKKFQSYTILFLVLHKNDKILFPLLFAYYDNVM